MSTRRYLNPRSPFETNRKKSTEQHERDHDDDQTSTTDLIRFYLLSRMNHVKDIRFYLLSFPMNHITESNVEI